MRLREKKMEKEIEKLELEKIVSQYKAKAAEEGIEQEKWYGICYGKELEEDEGIGYK